MIPFNCSEYVISNRIELTVLDIEHLTGAVKSILDKNFVSICEGRSGTDLVTAKKEVANLYARKDEDWKMGATAEFFVHLYLRQYRTEGMQQRRRYGKMRTWINK